VIETDWDKRREAALQEEAKRDRIVKGVFNECKVTVISDRKTIAQEGWNAQYVIECGGRRLTVKDDATIPLSELTASIQEQLNNKP